MTGIRSVIAATGSCLPEIRVRNSDFINHQFLQKDGSVVPGTIQRNIEKFREITGIEERRYARNDQTASDLAYLAAIDALETGKIDKESIDYIIVAHNFGDVTFDSNRVNIVPSLASMVKYKLQINNPHCIAYDLVFGCPGWIQGVIQADYFIRSGDAKRCLIIGTETLSRVIDQNDRDSMIYADGAGAVIMDAAPHSEQGIIAHGAQTFASEHALLLTMAASYNADCTTNNAYLKMNGRALYEFALSYVPVVIKETIDKAGVPITEIKKILIHQANEKMDIAILKRLYKLYDIDLEDYSIMPMTIAYLGNSSVATIPTLLDLILKNKVENQQVLPGDKVVFASVGAGMNINAFIYQF
ncbi:3-oxoacyl-ACP synthase III family protein [Flavihumibacter sp. UBA7668]|uniref:3-oxoacyl-ACP synthase III family protein n=1 Tax=Flavihumibacter sp. UBA7668 TaxID=1946542 RepID=UPI0025BCE384|nr:ketoacyl-ACP synthase III [Flavihumibacter sp. UBA7668]